MFQMVDGEQSNEMSFQVQPNLTNQAAHSPFEIQAQDDETFKNEASSLVDQDGKPLGPKAFESQMPHHQNPIIALNCSEKTSINTVYKGKERSKSRSKSPNQRNADSSQVCEDRAPKSCRSSAEEDKKHSTSTASSRKVSPQKNDCPRPISPQKHALPRRKSPMKEPQSSDDHKQKSNAKQPKLSKNNGGRAS